MGVVLAAIGQEDSGDVLVTSGAGVKQRRPLVCIKEVYICSILCMHGEGGEESKLKHQY